MLSIMNKTYLVVLAVFIGSIAVLFAGNVFACNYHAYQQCQGNTLYWYDSCGNQQDSQYCSNGCYNGICQNYNNYNNNNCNNNNYNYSWNFGDGSPVCVSTSVNSSCTYGSALYKYTSIKAR